MSTRHCEIAVIGGGIAGASAAAALTQAGFEVQLIERGAAPAAASGTDYDPRVYAISPGSAAWLASLGVWETIRRERCASIRRMQVWDREPGQALRFDAGDAGSEALGWIVEHRRLALAAWSALPDGCARTGVDVQSLRFGDAAVELSLSDGSTLHAQLAIGAEGADSALREAAGIDTAGWRYPSAAVVCHLECSEPHRGLALQRFLPSGPVALLPLADGRRSLVWSTSEPDAEALLALDDTSFAQQLQDAVQSAAGTLSKPTRRLRFALRLLHAERYVAPRCALVGDSAHVVHPLAGQGLNLGLADVAQLVHELSTARRAGRDWSALRILSRYERARLAENLDMLALTDALSRAFTLDLPGWRQLLNLGMRTVDRVAPLKQALAQRATGPA